MEKDILPLIIIGFIISLLVIAGILFLIIYGLLKKKKAFWISGCAIALLCLLLYLFFYVSRTRRINNEMENIKRYEEALKKENALQ